MSDKELSAEELESATGGRQTSQSELGHNRKTARPTGGGGTGPKKGGREETDPPAWQ